MNLRIVFAAGLVTFYVALLAVTAIILCALSLALYAVILFFLAQIDRGLVGETQLLPMIVWAVTAVLLAFLTPAWRRSGKELNETPLWRRSEKELKEVAAAERAGCIAIISVIALSPVFLLAFVYMTENIPEKVFSGFHVHILALPLLCVVWLAPLMNALPNLIRRFEDIYKTRFP